jgi:sortase A
MLKIKFVAQSLSIICLALALISFAQGGYILLKGTFAQYLLNIAWHQTQLDEVSKRITYKPWPWADVYPVVKLSFKRLKLEQIVLNNDSGLALAFGPGLNQFNDSMNKIEQERVIIISAHNDTHFSFLNKLTFNDSVELTYKSGVTQTFNVSDIEIIDTTTQKLIFSGLDNSDASVEDKISPIKELYLVTCYPFLNVNLDTRLRYIVKLTS